MRSRVVIGLMLVTLVAWVSPALVAGRHLSLQDVPVASAAASEPTITAIAVGGAHTCALTRVGGVKCWGWNGSGQLGKGTTGRSLTPIDVSGLASGVTAITAGNTHTCALTAGGGAKCWGWNAYGQLGNGTTIDSDVPVDVLGLANGVIAIAVGGIHTCALTSGGRVTCWGQNVDGQLGNGTTSASSVPVDVSRLPSGIVAIAAGNESAHTCAITSGGGAKCWGWNDTGQLGNGTTSESLSPVDVLGLPSAITAIATGTHATCAITTGTGAMCWGYNNGGQLGNGTRTDSLGPVDVSGLMSGVTAISVASVHACALTSAGGVKCWGDNDSGQLGSTMSDSLSPIDVSGLGSGVTAIGVGGSALSALDSYTCALTSAGRVKCWGRNELGQLGNGTRTNSRIPVDVDFASQGLPGTDMAGPGAREGRADPPLLPSLAGLAAGIAILMRRRPREADDRPASSAAERSSRVDAHESGRPLQAVRSTPALRRRLCDRGGVLVAPSLPGAAAAAAALIVIVSGCAVPPVAERSASAIPTSSQPVATAADESVPPAAAATPDDVGELAIPTVTPSPSSPSPSTPPTAPPCPAPPDPTPAATPLTSLTSGPLRIDRLALVVVDGLRVRSAPGTGADSEIVCDPLSKGSEVFVLAGPVPADGYVWWQVPTVGRPGVTVGWVAAASRDGETWLASVTVACPTDPSIADLARLGGVRALVCYGRRDLKIRAFRLEECGDGASNQVAASPDWITYVFDSDPLLDREGRLGDGTAHWIRARAHPSLVMLGKPYDRCVTDGGIGWFDVTGHFDDPVSSDCRVTLYDETADADVEVEPALSVLACRATFVYTDMHPATGP